MQPENEKSEEGKNILNCRTRGCCPTTRIYLPPAPPQGIWNNLHILLPGIKLKYKCDSPERMRNGINQSHYTSVFSLSWFLNSKQFEKMQEKCKRKDTFFELTSRTGNKYLKRDLQSQ